MYDGIGDGIYMVAAVVIDLVEEKKYCHRWDCVGVKFVLMVQLLKRVQ